PLLGEGDAQSYEVLKEQLKARVGAKVNPLDVERFRREGRWQEPFELGRVPVRRSGSRGRPTCSTRSASRSGSRAPTASARAWATPCGRATEPPARPLLAGLL